MRMTLLWCLCLTALIDHARGYGRGAPDWTCSTMTPSHSGSLAQATPASDYQITTSSGSFTPGESITVTITALNGKDFKGYLMHAIDEGTGSVLGTFSVTGGGQTMCGSARNQAVTHTSKASKTTESFSWTAPANANGNIVFVSTIVQSYSVYWMNVRSNAVSPASAVVTTKQTTAAPSIKTSSTTMSVVSTKKPESTSSQLVTDKVTVTPAPPSSTTTPSQSTEKVINPSTRLSTKTDLSTSATQTTSTTPKQPPVAGALMMDASCGDTRGCFVSCEGTDCQYVVSWEYKPEYVDFSIERKVEGGGQKWVAIAFSNDVKMGDDDVFHCISDSTGRVTVARSFNMGTSNQPINNPQEGISSVSGSFTDGVFRCSFRYSQVAPNNRRKRQSTTRPMTDLHLHRHLMLGDGPAFGDSVGMHTQNPVVTADLVNLQLTSIIGDVARYPLVKVHGCLMILAWIFCTGVGLIFARFYKPVWSERTILGLKVWFQFHRGLMVTTLVLTLVGFIIIFVEANGYSKISAPMGKGYTESHPILGIIVTILTVTNPIMALFRPGPKDKNRPIFNWAHWAVGMAAHILGVITICFGVELQKVGAPKYTVFVVIGYIVYHVLMEITLKVYDLFAERQSSARIEHMEMKNGNGATQNGNSFRPEETKRDPKDSIIKKILLVFHVAIAFAFTLTLLLLVTQY
uniref:Ferric-chelate reductase 1 isoform X1 n=1 Tax=Crassostrea virginica TaxID=6565 RepID=A0A8B8CKY1_CRAVI|nr:putative ferric-chelate reductase 1 isoform X1 [Crassostrea virginica]XP_022316501.1 putative ferric-chelate reductase 1 isoform X1 [Crassostrea virginica]XP_022316502.1 putative ferric-chelate reductase 1 isoform X1 [Crassostrea virginica]